MTPARASRTAEGVAAIRAAEGRLRPPGRRVLEDPIAESLLNVPTRLLLRLGPLLRLAIWIDARRSGGMPQGVLARGRLAQERLDAICRAGVRQAVILGAGFDTTACGEGQAPDLKIFEVDLPASQDLKRRRLAIAGIPEPGRLVFVPFDLDGPGLADALAEAGHEPSRPSLVTALGLLSFLAPESVACLFLEAGRLMAPGSEFLYDHIGEEVLDAGSRSRAEGRAVRRLDRMGEPFRFAAGPGAMAALADRAGLDQVESLDAAGITQRFFASRGDRRTIAARVHLARAVKRK